MKHRTTTTTLLLAAALLAAATPANARSVAPPSVRAVRTPDARAWTTDAFPAGNAGISSAAKIGGHTTLAVGSRRSGQGRETTVSPVAFTRDGSEGPWREFALPEGLRASTAVPDGSGSTWVTGSRQGGSVATGRYRAGHWQVQDAPLPDHAMGGGLNGFAAAGGPDDVWAVGYYQPDDYLTFYGVIDHWDGESWQQVPTPDLGTDYWTLSAVVANGPSDVWASGNVGTEDGWTRPLLLHYDGHAWTEAATPEPDSRSGELTRLVAAGPNDIWAAGAEIGPSHQDKPIVAHYDGHRWTYQETGIDAGRLYGLVRTPGGVAVVGTALVDGVYRPTGAQLTRHGWEPLDVPQGTASGGRRPSGLVSVEGRLTVVGTDLAGTGDVPVELPFSVTR
ncbi:hypothetical protein [Kitasatospora phosalacinea]|uniref:hypothetical protein n=1 Tax=Kitasatospora phosalacinea TaxID=2065 RepID=UPI00052548D5|nr:hypothetical protein [Kitasatospora phosalacinea]